ncbi:MAG: DUF1127 domain-containing protein [Acetobacteraceae bacterium]
MDARITKEETALLLNLTPSRRAMEIEEIRLAAIRARDEAIGRAIRAAIVGLWRIVRDVARFVATYPRRRALFDQLNAMSDRELADIGLTRADLARVFDEDFGRVEQTRAAPRPAGTAVPVPANSNVAAARAA